MSDFDFIKDQSIADDTKGHAFDDIDMVISPRDGSLVVVGVVAGVHACHQCAEQFVDDLTSPLRMVEFNCGGHGTRIGIHSKCVAAARKVLQKRGDSGDLVHDMSLMHRARRFMTRATKPFRK